MNRSTRHDSPRGAFSLIELLAVIAILAIVGVLLANGFGGNKASQLSTSANKVIDQMSVARELAIAKNQPVEIWLIQGKGEKSISALQLRLVESDGSTSARGGLIRLGTGMGIDTGPTLSPIVNPANAKQWGATPQPILGTFGQEYDCWYIRIQPDGTPTLSPNSQHYLTLHALSDGDNLSQLPPNYAIVGISPTTGKTTLYRP